MHPRPTTSADLTGLPAIERSAGAVFRSIPALAWIADDEVMSITEHERLLAAGWCWVAEHAERVCGFVCAEPMAHGLHVWELAVAQWAQGQGVGTALMHQLLAAAQSAEYAQVTLTTFNKVPWNAPFYERLGFNPLPEAQLDTRLQTILAAEAAAGLPMEQRCAMALIL